MPLPRAAAAALVMASIMAVPCALAADDAERSRIASERAAIEARFAARERECHGRFVVTSCIDDAKVDRRRGLDALRTRQLQLDEERRRERTAARSAELAAKAADDARREQDRQATRAPGPGSEKAARAGLATSAARSDAGAAARAPRRMPAETESAGERRDREVRSRASFESRQRQAQEHREKVLEKAAQGRNGRSPAAPLPVPASAPAR